MAVELDLKDYYDSTWLPYVDRRTKSWFLVTCYPTYSLAATVIYLTIVKIGPKLMKNREPYNCRNVMIIYNFLLVLSSLYMAAEICLSHRHASASSLCASYNIESWRDPKGLRLATVLWWHYFTKYVELFDTITLILRKNKNITWLHLIHHSSVLNITWIMMSYFPGGMSWFWCCLNSIVHAFMYTYYGLSIFPSCKGVTSKLKQYMTLIQVIQFILVIIYTSIHYVGNCDFPVWGQVIQFFYGILMIAMFSNFYIQSYLKNKKNVTVKAEQTRPHGTPIQNNNNNSQLDKRVIVNGTTVQDKKSI